MLKKILLLTLFVAFLNARVVVDDFGEKITLPDKVERASPMMGIYAQIAVSMGGGDRMVSGAPRGLTPMMLKIFPNIKMTGFKGSVRAGVEALIAARTQVIIGMSSMIDDNIKKQFEAAGIAVVRTNSKFATPQDVKEKVAKIAEVFGGESVEMAREFERYYDGCISLVSSRTDKISPKKRVLVLNFNAGNYSTITDGFVNSQYIRIAGGVHLVTQKGTLGSSPILNEEQVIVYNPDVIITSTPEGLEQIMKNPPFQHLKAIKNKQVFIQPEGVMPFWSGTEGALQVLWLAMILHPNEFKDIDIRAKVREFYEKFYRYKLSESELDEIFYPKDMRLLY